MREALKPGGSPAAYRNLQLESLKRDPPSALYAHHSLSALALLNAAEGERPRERHRQGSQQASPSAQGGSRAEQTRGQATAHPAAPAPHPMPEHYDLYPIGGVDFADPAEAVAVLGAASGGSVLLQSPSPRSSPSSSPHKRPWSSSRYRVGYGAPDRLMPGGVMEVPRWEYHCRAR